MLFSSGQLGGSLPQPGEKNDQDQFKKFGVNIGKVWDPPTPPPKKKPRESNWWGID